MTDSTWLQHMAKCRLVQVLTRELQDRRTHSIDCAIMKKVISSDGLVKNNPIVSFFQPALEDCEHKMVLDSQ